jgi:osmoprotectant transport system permease protein
VEAVSGRGSLSRRARPASPARGGPRRRAAAALALLLAVAAGPAVADGVVVGSKNFAENRLLAEIFAQLIEARTDLVVERRLGLAGTQVCFEALRSGAIDVYPEYTGTGLVSLLGRPPEGDAQRTLALVRREFRRRWDLHWLAPLGFENAYEIAVPRQLAEAEDLRRISDLAPLAARLEAGFGYEFAERPDGLPGLESVYGLRFAAVRRLQQAIKYEAAGAGRVDVLDVYTTDGRLLTHDLTVLEDDCGLFPPYEAVALVRGALFEGHPRAAAALALLTEAFDEATMRALNLRLQEGGESEARVAAAALVDLGLLAPAAAPQAGLRRRGLLRHLWTERTDLSQRLLEHIGLAALALGLGVLVAVPAGLALERSRRLAEPIIRLVGTTQTIPSIALLAFMIPLLGVGARPAIVALWIYSLYPIVRNTFSGVRDADPEAVAAAWALGMTEGQVLRSVRLPLAAPTIMAGVRTAGILTVGTATLAAFIGAGGLGEPIVTGLQLADTTLILSGALPAALLAVAVDFALGRLERAVRPRGLEAS